MPRAPKPGKRIQEACALVVAARKGQKNSCTPEAMAVIIGALKMGATYKLACDAAGIAQSTLFDWISQGEADPENSPYREIPKLVKQASAFRAGKALARIDRAGEHDWRAEEFILKYRYNEHFQLHKAVEITGRDGGPVQLDVAVQALEMLKEQVSKMQDEDLESVIGGEEE